MPWEVKIRLETDKTPEGNDIGNIIATFTDNDQFLEPFIISRKTELKGSDLPVFKQFCLNALTAERLRRQREANRAQAIENALNS